MMPELIVGLIVAIVIAIPSIISIAYFVKKLITEKNWLFIMSVANQAVVAVEKVTSEYTNVTSEYKINLALEIIAQKCKEAGCAYDEVAMNRVITYITQICKLAKNVNVK